MHRGRGEEQRHEPDREDRLARAAVLRDEDVVDVAAVGGEDARRCASRATSSRRAKRCFITISVSITGSASASIGPLMISAVGDLLGRAIEPAASSRPMNRLPVSPMKIFAGGLFQG